MNFDLARRAANAVMYEGYVLYPYRASSIKNRFRWQFGVVAPRGYAENGGCEPWEMQTECVIEPQGSPQVDLMVRFLELRTPAGRNWDEGVEQERTISEIDVGQLLQAERTEQLPAANGICAVLRLAAEDLGNYWKLRIRLENLTSWPEGMPVDRDLALRYSLVATHTLVGLRGGNFVSLMDPPPEAKDAVARCSNLRAWPVLAGVPGERDVMLSSPIILYDYPALAPESPGELCDSTEIDEILTLRVMTLTDEEKRQACATDERARAIIERSDAIPPEVFERLHGAIRQMSPASPNSVEEFFNPSNEAAPEHGSVQVGETCISAGDRVRIQPRRRADSMDLFLAGRVARVHGIHRDVDGRTHLALALDDEGGELISTYNRFFYFDPDEVEPLTLTGG